MVTACVIVQHLEVPGGPEEFVLAGGTLTRFSQDSGGRQRFAAARERFPTVPMRLGDWQYERHYESIPPDRTGSTASPAGDIAFQIEDLLLSMRLARPGDISFLAQALVLDDGRCLSQLPYRFFASFNSTRPYCLDPGARTQIETLLTELQGGSTHSTWFGVAKRFFLYGGAKEFNPYHGELDRILDYAIALESVLVHESSFVGRLLRSRVAALLGLDADEQRTTKKLVNKFYGYRSKLAHGEALDIASPQAFHQEMDAFDALVRRVLRRALEVVPANEAERKSYLRGLFAVSDAERLTWLREQVNHIEDADVRGNILAGFPTPG